MDLNELQIRIFHLLHEFKCRQDGVTYLTFHHRSSWHLFAHVYLLMNPPPIHKPLVQVPHTSTSNESLVATTPPSSLNWAHSMFIHSQTLHQHTNLLSIHKPSIIAPHRFVKFPLHPIRTGSNDHTTKILDLETFELVGAAGPEVS